MTNPGQQKPLPPIWYTRIERFFWFNWRLMAVIAFLAFLFLFPLVHDEGLDEPPPRYDVSTP